MTVEPEDDIKLRGAREKRERDIQFRVLNELPNLDGVMEVQIKEIREGVSYRVNIIGRRQGVAEFLPALERYISASHYVSIRRGLLYFEPPLDGQ